MTETLFDPKSKLHLVDLKGRKFITFVGLQAKLADQGKTIIGSDTEVITLPTPENKRRAVVKSTIKFAGEGDTPIELSCIGDADETNVGPAIAGATLRMAETRAQARCLRLATRSPFTSLEEIPPVEDARVA